MFSLNFLKNGKAKIISAETKKSESPFAHLVNNKMTENQRQALLRRTAADALLEKGGAENEALAHQYLKEANDFDNLDKILSRKITR